ncbi:hypothetical protein EDD16DRAFT_1472782 [Pisolithus croceorrhizus]|nr:hypothetical protein EV401DRAFT_1857359 [Pisolithus croceorrhizus]KAI6127911.1 hypothetical protein EDD16DRAFT_1472782 [Pisolithus croceorrhizus]KAI6150024.1 hypothetical protein EDD17DRAFT_1492289 [Pisolithus thermaeus]
MTWYSPQFVKNQFLICKHLVQAMHPVSLIFFLEVQQSRTASFWSHPALVPLDGSSLLHTFRELAA